MGVTLAQHADYIYNVERALIVASDHKQRIEIGASRCLRVSARSFLAYYRENAKAKNL